MAKLLLSLHGFHSSPASFKAQQMQLYVQQHHPEITFICPQLPCLPADMWLLIKTIFEQHKGMQIAVMGSSLGGYLAAKAVEKYQVKALLINPAVQPYQLLTQYLGLQTHPYLQKNYQIDDAYIAQLKSLDVKNISLPDNIWCLVQQGDEVLDPRLALKKYQSCKITSESGGDHSFVGFERFIPDIISFLF